LFDEHPPGWFDLSLGAARPAPLQPDLTRISRALPESDPGKLGGPAVVVLVTLAIVGTLWWFISSSGGEKPQPAVVQESRQSGIVGKSDTSSSAAAAAGAAVRGAGAQSGTAPEQAASPLADGAAIPEKVAKAAVSAPKPTAAASPGSAAATTTAGARAMPVGSAAAAGVPPLTRPNPTSRAKEGELTLKFSSDSWAEVYDASGQRLFYDVGAASSAHTVKGPAPLHVVLGNASGVALEYNGRPAPIPSGVLPDGSVRFVITARGRTAPATDGD
jgi:cytoskeleton protein RodZ